MTRSPTDYDELLDLLAIYVPYNSALRQMLGDLARSRAAKEDAVVAHVFKKLIAAWEAKHGQVTEP